MARLPFLYVTKVALRVGSCWLEPEWSPSLFGRPSCDNCHNSKEVISNRRAHVAICVKPNHKKFKRCCARDPQISLAIDAVTCHVRDGRLIVVGFLAGLARAQSGRFYQIEG